MVRRYWRFVWGVSWPTSKSDPNKLAVSGSRNDWLEISAAVPGLGGMRRLIRGLVSKPKTWIKYLIKRKVISCFLEGSKIVFIRQLY